MKIILAPFRLALTIILAPFRLAAMIMKTLFKIIISVVIGCAIVALAFFGGPIIIGAIASVGVFVWIGMAIGLLSFAADSVKEERLHEKLDNLSE